MAFERSDAQGGGIAMMIYTAHSGGKRADEMEKRGLGMMLHSCPSKMPSKDAARFTCALDNGAFSCWQRGFPFQERVFLDAIRKAYASGISLEFIVCPDIVAGGSKSLEFSMSWAMGKLLTAPRLALVVQDGMETGDLSTGYHLKPFSHLFVGGTPDWKWRTAQSWIDLAHANGMKCHIGQVGTLDRLRAAKRMGADSVDSTNFARHEAWDVIDEYNGCRQSDLFLESTNKEDEG